ncbi:MAG: phage terminase family protein [Oscillospiraceae bacterium]|nr:phage terminase family protein [Oscillospiraceae bacterium]
MIKASKYANWAIESEDAPKYVKLQCQRFLDILNGENSEDKNIKNTKYFVNLEMLERIENTLKLLIMPRGLKVGETIYDCSTGYQWLFYTSILCVVYKDNPTRRRYETAILEIGRKNFKTFTIATIFILLFLLEPKFSKFYSVAPDGSLSREVKTAIEEILKSSPKVYMKDETPRFKILRDYIKFELNENQYFPLNYSNSRMDGKLPNVFLADEVGALPNAYAIESMRSGQLNILNKLGCIISTKYPTIDNPFEEEIKYAKQVLDGITDDETIFALLYEPDFSTSNTSVNTSIESGIYDKSNKSQIKDSQKQSESNHNDLHSIQTYQSWTSDDLILKHANPVALEIPEIWEDLLKKRAKAIAMESARENFLTKHCNIIYQGAGTENFVDIADVLKCKVNKLDWIGREVYVGVDLSMTTDNTAVVMCAVDEDNRILADAWCFIPEGRIEEKNRFEKLDYIRFIEHKKCFACGNKTIDYGFVEDFVFKLEDRFGVTIRAIGFDRYNCLSSAQKWLTKYSVVEIRQHSDTLHAPTKLLQEKIINTEFSYEKNTLLEINFSNAMCVYDTNMNRYIHKKKSSGKVDMVAALINAIYLLQQDIIFEGSGITYAV